MSHYAEPQTTPSSPDYRSPSGWVGWIAFAGIMMVMLGTFHIVQGLVAVFNDTYFVVGKSGLVVHADYTAWGWTHVVLGAIVVAAGVGVFAGQMWARVVGVLIALLSALVNVAFLAAQPLWSLTMIALDVVVILALTVHGSDIKPDAARR